MKDSFQIYHLLLLLKKIKEYKRTQFLILRLNVSVPSYFKSSLIFGLPTSLAETQNKNFFSAGTPIFNVISVYESRDRYTTACF